MSRDSSELLGSPEGAKLQATALAAACGLHWGRGESKVPEVLPRRHPTSRFLGSWASAPSAQHPFVESLSEPQLGPEEQGMR